MLPYVCDADVAAEALEDDVLDVVHVLLNLLDLQVARTDRVLDSFDLRLQIHSYNELYDPVVSPIRHVPFQITAVMSSNLRLNI